MIFLTVGTQFPFDRLVCAIDGAVEQGLLREPIYAQIGDNSYKPRNFESSAFLEKDVFDKYVEQSSAIIGHAGMGTISAALSRNKPLLVMPRLKRFHEVVNDHQVAIARKFSQLGHILAAYDVAELPERIGQLKGFVPNQRNADVKAVAERIHCFLDGMRR